MRIKKIAAIMLVSAMAINMCACTAKEEKTGASETAKTEEKSSFDEAAYLDKITAEMTEHLAALTTDEEFGKLYYNEDAVEDIRKDVAGAQADLTKDYQEMIINDNVYDRYKTAIDEDSPNPSELSDEAKEQITRTIATSMGNMIKGRAGTMYIVFSTVYNYSRTYVPEEPVANRIRIIPTDKDVSYFVSFYNTGDGALTVSVSYLFYDETSIGELAPFFGDDLKTITR